jgi:hypothetical protein
LHLLAVAMVSIDGWVNLSEPIIMKAGEGFIAVTKSDVHDAEMKSEKSSAI